MIYRPFHFLLVLMMLVLLGGCDATSKFASEKLGIGKSPSDASANQPVQPVKLEQIVAQGRITPATGLVGVFAPIGDRIEEFDSNVFEGATVSKGDRLGRLASYRARELELEALKATIEESDSVRDALVSAKKSDLAAASSVVDQVSAASEELAAKEKEIQSLGRQLNLAVEECRRIVRLKKRSDLVSDRKVTQAKHAADMARAALDAAKIQYNALKESAKANLAVAKSKKDSVAAGHDRALAAIPTRSIEIKQRMLEEQLRESAMPAPADGTILKIYSSVGETVGRKPVMQIADLEHMVCHAEVYETYLKDIKVGQPAVLKSLAFEDGVNVTGVVQSVGRMIHGAELKELDPFAKSDVRVVEVTIEIDAGASTEQAARLVNLQVEVIIDTGESNSTYETDTSNTTVSSDL